MTPWHILYAKENPAVDSLHLFFIGVYLVKFLEAERNNFYFLFFNHFPLAWGFYRKNINNKEQPVQVAISGTPDG